VAAQSVSLEQPKSPSLLQAPFAKGEVSPPFGPLRQALARRAKPACRLPPAGAREAGRDLKKLSLLLCGVGNLTIRTVGTQLNDIFW
jgi:hypothetical protein